MGITKGLDTIIVDTYFCKDFLFLAFVFTRVVYHHYDWQIFANIYICIMLNRLDGSTPSSDRQNLVEMFNNPENARVKCTLISTRAGSLGINLHAANRVVLLDGSWNPTHDLQAIYRVWRYGQTKPVYAYCLMTHRTMEEKIYKQQVDCRLT